MRRRFSNEDLHNKMLALMLPEFRQRQTVLAYIRANLTQAIKDNRSGITLEEYIKGLNPQYTLDEVNRQLKGESPFSFRVLHDLCLMLGKTHEANFPYDPNVPDSKYTELHQELFNRVPDAADDPTGRGLVRFYLQESFFQN